MAISRQASYATFSDDSEDENKDAMTGAGLPVSRTDAEAFFDQAWLWLCASRRNAPPDADIWHLRYHWATVRDNMLNTVLRAEYRLMPMLLTRKSAHRERQVIWSAADALVLKWVALLVAPLFPLHSLCEHVKGHGGGRQSVRRMTEALRQKGYAWVCRTDIRGYYRNINKNRLMSQVCRHVHSPVLRGLIWQYIHYSVEDGGEFYTPASGIARGCALSPLIGAMHLYAMDEWFAGQMRAGSGETDTRMFYARYMDDIVILAHTRWQLRKHVRAMNKFLNEGGFCQHPDKTFIGRTERGFDWMGAQIYDAGVENIAPRARLNHAERLRRLYERVRKWPAERRQARMSQYRSRWNMWAAGLLVSGTCMHAPDALASFGSSADSAKCLEDAIADGSIQNNNGTLSGTIECNYPPIEDAYARSMTGSAYTDGPVAGVGKYWIQMWEMNKDTWKVESANHQGSIEYTYAVSNGCNGALVWNNLALTSPNGVPNNAVTGTCAKSLSYTGNPLYDNYYVVKTNSTTSGNGTGIHATGNLTVRLTLLPTTNTVINMPKIYMAIQRAENDLYHVGTITLGGRVGDDPSTKPPVSVLSPPNCSTATTVNAQTIDAVISDASFRGVIKEAQSPVTVLVDCLAPIDAGTKAASARVYVQSPQGGGETDRTFLFSDVDGVTVTRDDAVRLQLLRGNADTDVLPPSCADHPGETCLNQTATSRTAIEFDGQNETMYADIPVPEMPLAGRKLYQFDTTAAVYSTGSGNVIPGPRVYTVNWSVVIP